MLLDTHVLLWLLDDNPRLGPRTRALLSAGRAVHVSAASLWELAIKSELGKVTVPADLPSRVAAAGLSALPATGRHCWAVREVTGLPHRDPFDRLLLAQAHLERLTLVTVDSVLLTCALSPAVALLDARS